ncbi:uncharacterized protein [Lolium perenne]|uniref:uncharacterized protein isoform X2 n=1 Tax=Lolium perenne TaxID=4522 RepID=UPI0021F5B654|nr:uncharacterized protein LOC127340816 isoform X2 [Lolium perenne]
MSESEGADKTRRRGGSSPASPASLPDDEDLLWEILLRLPPLPSSLPRASAVCRRWRRLMTDPKFIARFRAHHRKPPLLGVFHRSSSGITFVPILDPPDRIRFDMRCYGDYDILGCRHGRVLAMNRWEGEVLVCDPVAGEQHRVAAPSEFSRGIVNGAVLCPAADDQGHVHGGCPFKVVLMTLYPADHRPAACVYSSETGTWGDLVKTPAICQLNDAGIPGALVGNALYWLQHRLGNAILVFDLDEQNLAVIEAPPVANGFRGRSSRIIQAEGGAVGLAILSYPRFQMWRRNVNCHGVATWAVWKTIEMHNIPGLPLIGRMNTILGYSEDTDAFFIFLEGDVYMVQFKSMQSKRLHETEYICNYHPFTSFYTPGQ